MAEFWTGYAWPTIWIVLQIVVIVIPLLLAVAYLTYAERKVIAAMQLRQGPMVVGPLGLLQPIADAVKLLVKETVIPSGANKVVFIAAPMITFTLALIGWAVIPFGAGLVISDINVGVLYLFAISSLGVYGIIMAGWASNSRYAFLGALRSAAQMVSYEISIGLIIINVLITVGSLNLSEIVLAQRNLWFFIPHLPDVRDLRRLDPRRDQPPPVRPAGGRGRAGVRLQRRVFGDALRALLPWRVRQHDPDERDLLDPVPRRLAAAIRHPALHLDPGPLVADRQDLLRSVHLHLGARDPAALPLRPTDASRLEGVPAGITRSGWW